MAIPETIHDKLARVYDTKKAIRASLEKREQPVTDADSFRSYADKILEIGKVADVKNVVFRDYDGTVLYSYNLTEIQELTELPIPPPHDRLVFQEWNWSLEELKTLDYSIDVGPLYTTKSGQTEIDVILTDVTGLSINYFLITNDTTAGQTTINWGDGTTATIATKVGSGSAIVHTYDNAGSYTILINSTQNFVLYAAPTSNTEHPGFSTVPNYLCTSIRCGGRCVDLGFILYNYNLKTISISNQIKMKYSKVFKNCISLKSCVIPKIATTLGGELFSGCVSLKYPMLSNRITDFASDVFTGCVNLINATLPDSIITLYDSAFYNCNGLISVRLSKNITAVYSGLFQNCYNLDFIDIPENVTTIGTSAFQDCRVLSSIKFSSNITSIGGSAFKNCYSLKTLYLPENLVSIDANVFEMCTALETIDIPDSITTIGTSAFNGCSNLTEITIPVAVRTISATAFQNCAKVRKYKLLSNTPPTLSNKSAFTGISGVCIIEVPQGSLMAYKTATNWSTYASYMREADE